MIRKRHPAFAALLALSALVAIPLFAQQNKPRQTVPADNAQAHWAQWRGPFFNGMAATDAPTQWSDKQNIKWKAAIPGRGHSTPVIWGDKIFLTTAIPTNAATPTTTPPNPGPSGPPPGGGRPGGGGVGAGVEHKLIVMALDRKTGKVLWQQSPKTATPHEGYHAMYGSFASNSPVTDGKNVWAFFGSRGLYCYDLNGKLIWEKDFGVQMKMRLQFGEGGAPALDGNTLVLLFDHDGKDAGGSFLVALDKTTGKELWRTAREEGSDWTSPLIFEHAGRKQVAVSATRKVRSYDLANGKLIWECGGLGINVIPQPIYHDGVVYVMSGYVNPKLLAIRLGKDGDLTGTEEVLWNQTRGLSYTASPVLHEGKLYTLTDNGMFSAFNAKTGEPYYHQQRLPKPYNFKASPVGANGKLYLASEDGDVIVLKLGEKYEVLATNTLADQVFISSPIIVDGELFLRSQNQLFCISETKPK
ncbi:MAG: PQQ-binding-like beta-propeller repeat protein [Acidobacteria bacterium]|nr:PQQ-binding-like beta-propeller repeat protein [Acidobacteriota bacterium]